MATIDLDGAVALLAAAARQWAKDAQRDPHELALLAQWLGMEPEDLRRLLATPQPERPRRPLGRPRAV